MNRYLIDTIKDRSGQRQLRVLYKFFLRLNHSNLVLFVYDCDVQGNHKEENNTFCYTFPENHLNKVFQRGIENMFSESLFFENQDYDEIEYSSNNGSEVKYKTDKARKAQICKRITNNGVHFTVSHLMLKFKQKAMTQEEYLQLAADRWPELKALEAKGDFYTYEKRFAQIMKELELAVLQAHIGQVPKNHRKKSLSPPRLVK